MNAHSKFWVKVGAGVDGPFEGRALLFLPGFHEESLVCADEAGELWRHAKEIPELSLLWAPLVEAAVATPPQSDPVSFGSFMGESLPASDSVSGVQVQDMLQKLSQEVARRGQEAEPVAEVAPSDVAEELEEKPAEPPAAVEIHLSGKKTWIIIAAVGLLVAGAIGFYFYRSHHKPKTVVVEAPKPPEPVVEKPAVVKKAVPKKIVPVKVVAPAPKPAARRSPSDPSLDSQRYMLPGVPSPNVESKSASHLGGQEPSGNESAIEEKPAAKPQDKKPAKEKAKKSASNDDVDWISQSGWGK